MTNIPSLMTRETTSTTPLRDHMRSRRVKQIPTAARVGLSQAQLSKIVNGHARADDQLLRRIATAVGIECPADPQALVTTSTTTREAATA